MATMLATMHDGGQSDAPRLVAQAWRKELANLEYSTNDDEAMLAINALTKARDEARDELHMLAEVPLSGCSLRLRHLE